jgi:hypothetical protein
MLLRNRMSPRTLIQIGLFALGIANVGNWVLHRHSRVAPDWADGVAGFCYGVAIATLLLGVWKSRRVER